MLQWRNWSSSVKQLVAAIGAVLIADCCQRCSVLNLSEWPVKRQLWSQGCKCKGVSRGLFLATSRDNTVLLKSATVGRRQEAHKKVKDGETTIDDVLQWRRRSSIVKLLVPAIGAVLIADCCQRCSVLNSTSGSSNDSFGRKGASAKGRREVSFWRRDASRLKMFSIAQLDI